MYTNHPTHLAFRPASLTLLHSGRVADALRLCSDGERVSQKAPAAVRGEAGLRADVQEGAGAAGKREQIVCIPKASESGRALTCATEGGEGERGTDPWTLRVFPPPLLIQTRVTGIWKAFSLPAGVLLWERLLCAIKSRDVHSRCQVSFLP